MYKSSILNDGLTCFHMFVQLVKLIVYKFSIVIIVMHNLIVATIFPIVGNGGRSRSSGRCW